MRRSILAVAALCALLATGAAPGPEPRPLDPADGLSAIVRLTRDPAAPGGACSGVLIAPDLVLTAGHCGPGRDAPPRALFVQIGWSGTEHALTLRAAGYDRHPQAPPVDGLTLRNVGTDLALVRLPAPVAPDIARPLPLAAAPPALPTEAVALAGYRNGGPPGPQVTAPCEAAPLVERTLLIACRVVSGNSGGAVLREGAAGWELLALISASGAGTAYAALPGDWVTAALSD